MRDTIRPTATAQFSLAADPRSVTRARKLLARVLDDTGVDGEARSDALLVASELVTNAISHGSRTGDEISIAYTATPGERLSISVRDSTSYHRKSLLIYTPSGHFFLASHTGSPVFTPHAFIS